VYVSVAIGRFAVSLDETADAAALGVDIVGVDHARVQGVRVEVVRHEIA
jgi:hypothetical protein